MDQVLSRDLMELYEAGHWSRVQESCLNCGTCTYCCPTCHCFDIQDETQGEAGRRVRNWDTCMSWLFTMHGTGHNPRGSKLDRVRQRFMHKFKYIPAKRGGEIGCVGCGRCVQLCPVNIDVRRVVNDMNA
jgi:formate hydrogenlyase subunit 6/NADH:ubiquinone oxidoreductase subunit I